MTSDRRAVSAAKSPLCSRMSASKRVKFSSGAATPCNRQNSTSDRSGYRRVVGAYASGIPMTCRCRWSILGATDHRTRCELAVADERQAFLAADIVDDLQDALAIGAVLDAEFLHEARIVDQIVAG